MNYRKCLISDLRENLDNGSITSEELFKEAVSLANKYQEPYNCFVTICDKFKMKKRTTPIASSSRTVFPTNTAPAFFNFL